MSVSYSYIDEELISQCFQGVIRTLRVYHLLSERIGLEMSLQDGRVCASNLNFYKTNPERIGNINCVPHNLSDDDRDRIKQRLFDLLKILRVRLPFDMIGQVEIIADFDMVNKMRIRQVTLNT